MFCNRNSHSNTDTDNNYNTDCRRNTNPDKVHDTNVYKHRNYKPEIEPYNDHHGSHNINPNANRDYDKDPTTHVDLNILANNIPIRVVYRLINVVANNFTDRNNDEDSWSKCDYDHYSKRDSV